MAVKRPHKGRHGATLSKEFNERFTDLFKLIDDRFQQISEWQIEAHKRLRVDMEKGFNDVFAQARAISEQTRQNSDRTLVIETERGMERRAGMKIGAIWGAIAGAVTSALSAALLRVFSGD